MPNPLEILLDPISFGIIALYALLIFLEAITPGRKLVKVKGWIPRTLGAFILYFYLATYLPLFWDQYLLQYQLFNLQAMNIYLSIFIALLVFEFLTYIWHRAIHSTPWLWRSFHQMHHSAERIDTYGAFYFSPLDMAGFTFIGSLSLSLLVGLSSQAVTYFLFITMFMAIFQHCNIKTPVWLGYIIQRPESHTIHHSKGVHHYNYSDLPLFDIIFGTFRNPEKVDIEVGFYNGASKRIIDMMLFRDVSTLKESLELPTSAMSISSNSNQN